MNLNVNNAGIEETLRKTVAVDGDDESEELDEMCYDDDARHK